MKTLVISTPAMGKTSLVKMHRTASWRNSSGVDFDLKGHNNHSANTRESSTLLVNALFDKGHTFVTGFNGSFDFSKLTHRCHIIFVAPATKDAMQGALERSFHRGDSAEFIADMVRNLPQWAADLYKAYRLCYAQSRLPSLSLQHKVTFVGIRDAYTVIPDLFSFDRDNGELELRTLNEIEYSNHKFAPGTEVEYTGELTSPSVIHMGYYEESLPSRYRDIGMTFYSHHRDALYPELLQPVPNGDERNFTFCESLTHLENDFDNALRMIRSWDDVDAHSVRLSFDAFEHSVPRARMSYDVVQPLYDDDNEIVDYHRYNAVHYWFCQH